MTIIVFRSGIMASDGRVSEDSSIFTNRHQKIHRLKSGGLVGVAGDADTTDLVNLLNSLRKPLPTHKQLCSLEYEFDAIYVKPDKTVWVLQSGRDKDTQKYVAGIFEIKEPFVAVGSGKELAIGALDRGATAEQAVKTAIKFDTSCGGPIQVFSLESKDE